jgi:hypothetical protein
LTTFFDGNVTMQSVVLTVHRNKLDEIMNHGHWPNRSPNISQAVWDDLFSGALQFDPTDY